MFVNQIAYLITHSKGINLIVTKYQPGMLTKHIAKQLLSVVNMYQKDGFKIQTILTDNEFNKVSDELPHLVLNTATANEHVGEVEHQICLFKECSQGIISTLHYKRLPNL